MVKIDLAAMNDSELNESLKVSLVDWLIEKGEISADVRDVAINRLISDDSTNISEMIKELNESHIFRNNEETYIAHDKMTKQIKSETFVAARLSNVEKKKSTAVVTMTFFDENGVELSKPLSMFELTVLQAVYSILEAGNDRCTAMQIYQKMRGNFSISQNKQINASLEQINAAMWKLRSTIVSLKCEDETGKRSDAAVKWLRLTRTDEPLISFRSESYVCNGKTTFGYVFKGERSGKEITTLPIFYRLSKIMNHNEVVSDEVVNIKKINAKTGRESTVQLSNEKATIVKYLLDFCLTYRRSNGHCADKKPYEMIFNDCDVEITSRMMNKRMKEFVQIVLEHFKRYEVISGYKEYNKGRGVQIKTKKEEG